ncbi:UPF0691 protein C9orf116 homolog isoform X1 [Suricata suricatta]|uniref:UPF0691 protein C9orf116 homolog isoform X1 n=1 Tax=Suricata suricatta TaxID=37032 RepID=UPI00115547DF|nr:UPF0691 protein C9orf116 homolog isoform X1 [Suricata suricatta]
MAQRNSLECTEAAEPPAPEPPGPAPPQRTSDYYRIDGDLPVRFNNPAWFRGYGTKEAVSMYRTSNQTYGSRAPTVHEMPTTCSGWKVPEQYSQRLSGEERCDGSRQLHHRLRPAGLPPQLQRQQALHLRLSGQGSGASGAGRGVIPAPVPACFPRKCHVFILQKHADAQMCYVLFSFCHGKDANDSTFH